MPPEVKERIERAGQVLAKVLMEAGSAQQGERSTADYHLCCTCARLRFSQRDAALTLAAYGSEKVAEKFHDERVSDYVARTVRRAYARVKDDELVKNLLSDLPDTDDPGKATGKFVFRDFNEILAAGRKPPVALIKGYLHANSMSVLYGPPNNGKTLLATDMGYCVATGRPWGKMKTYPQGLVIYCVLEGAYGFTDRLFALHRHYSEDAQEMRERFIVLETSLDLRSENGDTRPLIARMRTLSEERGQPIAMIVFDTLVAALAGGNENASEDMNPVFLNGSAFKEAFSAHVMFVAHSGKDVARGIRGWSGQGAHIDSQFLVERECITVEKQRYLAKRTEGLGFERKEYVVGKDEDGDDETAVVAVITGEIKAKAKEGLYGPTLRAIITVLREATEPMTLAEIREAMRMGEIADLREGTIKEAIRQSQLKERHIFKCHKTRGKANRYSLDDGADLLVLPEDTT